MKPHQPLKDPDNLPSWFVRPYTRIMDQSCLFRLKLSSAIARLGVSIDDLRRWHDRGWISFDGKIDEELDEFYDPKILEITFVRDIVRSGLTDAQIDVVFAKLPKPFAFDSNKLAYSFLHGWVEVNTDPCKIIAENLDSWLEDCSEDTLNDLLSRIIDILEQNYERNNPE